MGKADFASAVLAKLDGAVGTDGTAYGNGTPAQAMAAVAAAVSEYLIANTTVTVSYNGVVTSTGSPDPLIADTFKITGSCAAPAVSDGFDTWIKAVEANIIAGFTLAAQGTAGLVFATKPFLNTGIATTRADLTALFDVGDTSPQQKIWEAVCGGIMDWINGTAINTVQGAASNPAASSAGTAVITKITIL